MKKKSKHDQKEMKHQEWSEHQATEYKNREGPWCQSIAWGSGEAARSDPGQMSGRLGACGGEMNKIRSVPDSNTNNTGQIYVPCKRTHPLNYLYIYAHFQNCIQSNLFFLLLSHKIELSKTDKSRSQCWIFLGLFSLYLIRLENSL
jgi:hypothetical protein